MGAPYLEYSKKKFFRGCIKPRYQDHEGRFKDRASHSFRPSFTLELVDAGHYHGNMHQEGCAWTRIDWLRTSPSADLWFFDVELILAPAVPREARGCSVPADIRHRSWRITLVRDLADRLHE
jgi:hypothetical protein